MNTQGNLKTKFFGNVGLSDLQKTIDKWLLTNKVNIIDIKFNTITGYHTLLILYYE